MNEHRIVYEEIPGSRTTQDAISQPQRERIAYEELQPGDVIQDNDEWQNADGRWQRYMLLSGSRVLVRQSQRARRPYNITQLQDERDEARAAVTQMMVQLTNQAEVLAEVRADEKRLFDDLELLRSEYAKLQGERDEARAERDKLQGLIDDLLDEPTAKQVQDMLRTWATELDWSAGCFDSVAREQIDTIQQTLVAVIERIDGMLNPEGGSDDN